MAGKRRAGQVGGAGLGADDKASARREHREPGADDLAEAAAYPVADHGGADGLADDEARERGSGRGRGGHGEVEDERAARGPAPATYDLREVLAAPQPCGGG